MWKGPAGPVLREFPPRAWELTRTRAWAIAGCVAFGGGAFLITMAFLALRHRGFVPVAGIGGASVALGIALFIKSFAGWSRLRAIRRECVRWKCSAWTVGRSLARTVERRRSWFVRRGLPWYEIQSGVLNAASDPESLAVVLPAWLAVRRYGLRGTIESRLEQDLTETACGGTYVARLAIERWDRRIARVDLRCWLVCVEERSRRGGLVPPAVVLSDRIDAARVSRDLDGVLSFEFDLPAGLPPGDVLADPPRYWALVVEGGEEPFVFRSVFSAALCRLDDEPVSP